MQNRQPRDVYQMSHRGDPESRLAIARTQRSR